MLHNLKMEAEGRRVINWKEGFRFTFFFYLKNWQTLKWKSACYGGRKGERGGGEQGREERKYYSFIGTLWLFYLQKCKFKCYKKKLALGNKYKLSDLFSIKNGWVDDIHHLPDIQHLDLVIYPILASTKFNKKSIASYKSFKAYTFFVSVFVFVILVKLLLPGIILGKNCIGLSDAALNKLFF